MGSAISQRGGIEGFLALRLMQIAAYEADVRATPRHMRAAKKKALDDLVRGTSALPNQIQLPPRLAGLKSLADTPDLPAVLQRLADELAPQLDGDQAILAMLELAVSTDWPAKVTWHMERGSALAVGAGLLDESVLPEHLSGLRRMHKRAFRRLRQDSVSPGMQLTLGAVLTGTAALSGGISNAVGTAIGTHVLGYSGAAATSAGLALLGGGSLAAGGFGMAGGSWLIGHAAHSVAKGTMSLAGRVAMDSSAAMIQELAKLDVSADLLPHRAGGIMAGLAELERGLRAELAAVRPEDLSARRMRTAIGVGKLFHNPFGGFGDLRREFPPQAERNLAAAVRAVDFEIRHLSASDWERRAYRVPRLLAMPGLSKLYRRGSKPREVGAI